MENGEKRRKFHDALMRTFYPPKPLIPNQVEDQKDDIECVDLDIASIESYNETLEKENYSNDENESGDKKLTRAQRKRIRKRKLKEASLHRRKLIGPWLPSAQEKELLVPSIKSEGQTQSSNNT